MGNQQDDLAARLRRDAERARQARENERLRRVARIRRLIRLARTLADDAPDDVLWSMVEKAMRFGEGKTGPIVKALFPICGLPVTVQHETVGLSEPRSDVLGREGFSGEAIVRYAAFIFRDGRRPTVCLDVESLNVTGDHDAAADHLLGMREPRPGMARRWLRGLLDDLADWLGEYEKNPGVRRWGTPTPAAELGEGVWLSTDGTIGTRGPMTPGRILPVLLDHLGRFLAHLDTLDRDDGGRYVVGESDDTRTRGTWESWQIIQHLAGLAGQTMLDIPPGHGMGLVEPRPGVRPIAETLTTLPFTLVKPRGEHWPATIPAEKVEKIKAYRDELALWLEYFRRVEQKYAVEAEAEAGGVGVEGGHDPEDLRPAAWFKTVTRENLYPQLLTQARIRGRLDGTKRGKRWYYSVAAVAKIWPEYEQALNTAANET